MPKVTICFTLDSERDANTLAWLATLDKGMRSEVLCQVLAERLGGAPVVLLADVGGQVQALAGDVRVLVERASNGVTLTDVYEAMVALTRRIEAGGVIAGGCADAGPVAEPEDLAAALDKLGKL